MEKDSLQNILQHAVTLAHEAGQLLMEGYRKRVEITLKGSIDIVTEYDLKCEKMVQQRLNQLFPSHTIIGEELPSIETSSHLTWYVDPLDGTTNFTHGHPFFGVSLGLWMHGQPLLGVVRAPALNLTWSGAVGVGVFRDNEPCHPSNTPSLGEALCATGFAYDRRTNPNDNTAETAAFLKKIRGLRRCGSAAIDLCLVADGTYDLYWERGLKPWDMAAGAALVLAGGGQLSGYNGHPISGPVDQLVASNGKVHKEAIELLTQIRNQHPANGH